jgi:hypothetical protein
MTFNPFPQHHYVNSPLSISGSVLRSGNILKHATYTPELWVDRLVVKPLVAVLLAGYIVFAVGWTLLLGLITWPLRLLRRGSRARKVERRQHAELLAAMQQQGQQS